MCGEWSSGCVRRFWRVDGSASVAARANGTLYGDGSGVPDGHAGELLQWAEVLWAAGVEEDPDVGPRSRRRAYVHTAGFTAGDQGLEILEQPSLCVGRLPG